MAAKAGEFHAMTIAGNDQRNLTGSFPGLRVLDFSTTIAGPHCTRMLADMGAEVIKIETEEGETMRTRPPVRNNCSTAFGQLNVGKNSLVLDLKSPRDWRRSAGWSRPRTCWWRISVPA
jgi:crotonobetainyl-CoA:carnitine CoA-transferase CaiB-like acyl-CoA transferase